MPASSPEGWLVRVASPSGPSGGSSTCVGVVAGLLAGVPVVPVDPKSGERELEHIVGDSDPEIVLAGPGARLPRQLAGRRLLTVDLDTNTGAAAALPTEPDPERRR